MLYKICFNVFLATSCSGWIYRTSARDYAGSLTSEKSPLQDISSGLGFPLMYYKRQWQSIHEWNLLKYIFGAERTISSFSSAAFTLEKHDLNQTLDNTGWPTRGNAPNRGSSGTASTPTDRSTSTKVSSGTKKRAPLGREYRKSFTQ